MAVASHPGAPGGRTWLGQPGGTYAELLIGESIFELTFDSDGDSLAPIALVSCQ